MVFALARKESGARVWNEKEGSRGKDGDRRDLGRKTARMRVDRVLGDERQSGLAGDRSGRGSAVHSALTLLTRERAHPTASRGMIGQIRQSLT